MHVRGIALPHGSDLIWITVGKPLNPDLGAHSIDETVESIVKTPTGFQVEALNRRTGRVRYYQVEDDFVCRVELLSGAIVQQAEMSGGGDVPKDIDLPGV